MSDLTGDAFDGHPTQLTRIEAVLTALNTRTSSLLGELRRIDQRTTSAKRAAAVGVIVGAVSVSVAIGALAYGLDARATAQDIVEARREALTSGCIQANITTDRERSALVSALVALVPPGQALTPTQQATVDRYRAEVIGRLPYRDCTQAGIDEYLSHPPGDPATAPPTTIPVTTGATR